MSKSYLYAMRAMGSYVNPELQRAQLLPVCKHLEKYSRGASLYPRQKTLMKIIFLEDDQFNDYDMMVIEQWMESTRNGGDVAIPLDLFDRIKYCKEHGYRHFREVIYCGGRRGGKGFIGGKIAEILVRDMIALGNPQRYYGVDESKQIHIDVLATNYSQAQGMLYNDIKDAILNDDWIAPYISSTSSGSQWINTPADMERRERLLKQTANKNSMRANTSSIVISPSAASSTSIRGRASILQCFDEFAHGLDTESAKSSNEIYEAATPSLTQFGNDGMIYIPSSPWSETGKFFELYKAAFKTADKGDEYDPTMFAIKIPSWGPYEDWQYDPSKKRAMVMPPEKSREMKAREMRNPEAFAVEFRANFAKTENAYLNSKVVDQMFAPYIVDGVDRNTMNSVGRIQWQYRAHADAGRSQDLFAFALGHKELGADGYWHAFIDLYKVWQPSDFPLGEDGVRRVDYTVVMAWFKTVFRDFFVGKFTMDQWNSGYFLDEMRAQTLNGAFANKTMSSMVDNHTSGANFIRWEGFKTAAYQGWVHIPHYEEEIVGLGTVCLPQEELKLLTVKNGKKVDHQNGSRWDHNDVSDCISTVVYDLLSDQLGSFEQGNLSKVVGAAQGGYNIGSNGFIYGANADVEDSLKKQSQNYFEQAGYGHYY